jgi:LacI family transcriptional regulator
MAPTPHGASSTISDVARRAGVSPATVSRVLNSDYPVSAATRARVSEAVRELSYVRNAHARALRATSTAVVGVVIHDVSDPFFSEIVAGIQEVATANHKLVVLCNSPRDLASELQYLDLLRGQRVDAVILTGGAIRVPGHERELGKQARALRLEGSRLILCGRRAPGVDSILADNVGGAQLLGRYLIERGHRRIAEVTGPVGFSTSNERSAGLRNALREAGVGPEPVAVISGAFSRDGGYEATRQLLRGNIAFTAIFAANDLMAVGALAALREAGRAVPADVSLVGFDDIPTMRDVLPGITTVRVPMREMGRQAMARALPGTARRAVAQLLPVQLVERMTVAAVA